MKETKYKSRLRLRKRRNKYFGKESDEVWNIPAGYNDDDMDGHYQELQDRKHAREHPYSKTQYALEYLRTLWTGHGRLDPSLLHGSDFVSRTSIDHRFPPLLVWCENLSRDNDRFRTIIC